MTFFVGSGNSNDLCSIANSRNLPGHRADATGSRRNDHSFARAHCADIQQAAAGELQSLAEACGDNVSLAVADENGVIYLRTVNNYQPRFVARSGDRATLHCTAVGKVMLAYQSEVQREQLIAGMVFERYTENTITDRVHFERELANVIERGYAVCDGEEFIQVCGIACPVFDFDGTLAGSINLWSLTERSSLEALKSKLPLLISACGRISQKLGYIAPDGLEGVNFRSRPASRYPGQ